MVVVWLSEMGKYSKKVKRSFEFSSARSGGWGEQGHSLRYDTHAFLGVAVLFLEEMG